VVRALGDHVDVGPVRTEQDQVAVALARQLQVHEVRDHHARASCRPGEDLDAEPSIGVREGHAGEVHVGPVGHHQVDPGVVVEELGVGRVVLGRGAGGIRQAGVGP